MSLITRCPACGTMFKVVTDQLKVSEGWVRCGHCAEVFDATLHLLPPDDSIPAAPFPSEMPAVPKAESAPQAPAPTTPKLPVAQSTAEQEWAPARSFADRVPLRPSQAASLEVQDSAADFDPVRWRQAQHPQPEFSVSANASLMASLLPDTAITRPEVHIPAVVSESESDFSFSNLAEDEAMQDAGDVSFVRDARRKAFWRTPLMRVVLSLLSLALLVLLALQWAVQQRDALAAIEPRLTPLLQAICTPLRCSIGPPHRIESMVIDSSTFNRMAPDVYRLGFTLKNVDVMPLAMPSLEVTLTDTQDQAVLRRILLPAQFGATSPLLAGQSEMAGMVVIKVAAESLPSAGSTSPPVPAAPLRVAGYRILAFYP